MSIEGDLTGKGLSVTIKYGKEFDKTWAVFKGTVSEIREQLVAYFELDDEGLTLHELVINATNYAHGTGAVAATLGATATGSSSTKAKTSTKASKNDPPFEPDPPKAGADEAAGDDPWAEAEAANAADEAQAERPNAALFDQVAKATDVDSLKLLYAQHQGAFTSDADLLAAWKAKGKSLKSA